MTTGNALKAERDRYREALEHIACGEWSWMVEVAEIALRGDEEWHQRSLDQIWPAEVGPDEDRGPGPWPRVEIIARTPTTKAGVSLDEVCEVLQWMLDAGHNADDQTAEGRAAAILTRIKEGKP